MNVVMIVMVPASFIFSNIGNKNKIQGDNGVMLGMTAFVMDREP